MNKKNLLSVLTVGMLTSAFGTVSTPAYAADPPSTYTIFVEDRQIDFDVQPFLVNDRAFVPMRALAEGLGGTVTYDAETSVATIVRGDITVEINFRTGVVSKNGAVFTMEAAPRIVNDRTMVPIHFISNAFGNEVKWNGSSNTVSVLPTADTMAKRENMANVLLESNRAMSALDSYRTTMNLKGVLNTPLDKLDLSYDMTLDYNKDPLAMHSYGSVDFVVGLQKSSQKIDSYMLQDKTYTYDPLQKEWVVMSNSATLSNNLALNKLANPNAYLEDLNIIVPYMTMREDANTYFFNVSLDRHGLKTTMQKITEKLKGNESEQSELDAITAEMTDEMLNALQKMELTYTINKKTHLQETMKMSMSIKQPQTGNQTMTFTGEGVIKDYNQVEKITVPEAVLQGATQGM